jgi:hypothetical protein
MLGILTVGITQYLSADELLTWDNQAVIAFYFMLQAAPSIWATMLGLDYAKKMRQHNQGTIRKAALAPKRLGQFMSASGLLFVTLSQAFYLVIVLYFVQNPFEGFAGYTNLFGLILIDTFFGALIYYTIFVKKGDPLQPRDNQLKDTVRTARILFIMLIAVTVKISIDLLLSGLDLRSYQDIMTCLYFNLIVAYSVYHYRFDNIDFDRYRGA